VKLLPDLVAGAAAALILSALVTEWRRCRRDRAAAAQLVLPRLMQQAAANALLGLNALLIGNWAIAVAAGLSFGLLMTILRLGLRARRRA
jgi:hypothetical protein